MRGQQAAGLGGGFLSPDHYAQLFSTHGSVMIFFMAMPFLTGLMNYLVPLQIGARDVSFPVLNSVGLGLTAAGAAIMMASLVVGEFSTGGWSGYPPYTARAFSPGEGPDYWIWAVSPASIGTTLTGINIACTIWKERCEGMRLMHMPMFCWTSLCVSILMIFAMPPLTVATAMLALDRYLDFHLFTTDAGGNMMNYANLFWLFGHPEVYILLLPALGVYSEVFSTFSGKTLYGYTSLVIATMAIAILSWLVWLHHFFTMGQPSAVNAAFGIATMTIGVPTGVKVYDWILTMWGGRVRIAVPMIYALGFLSLFVIGGLSGIVLANPSVDYQVHNSLFLVAHFHNMLIPATLFGMLAGLNFWFPKAFGFRLDPRWGTASALLWIGGLRAGLLPALRPGPDGDAAAERGLPGARLAALDARGLRGRAPDPGRARHAPDPALGQRPRPRPAGRAGGGPVGRAIARMVDLVAAARMELRRRALRRAAATSSCATRRRARRSMRPRSTWTSSCRGTARSGPSSRSRAPRWASG